MVRFPEGQTNDAVSIWYTVKKYARQKEIKVMALSVMMTLGQDGISHQAKDHALTDTPPLDLGCP